MSSWHFEGKPAEEMFREVQREQEERDGKRGASDSPNVRAAEAKALANDTFDASKPRASGHVENDYTLEAFAIPLERGIVLLKGARGFLAKFHKFGGEEVAEAGAKGGIQTANGIKITGFAKHGLDRAIERGVKPNTIFDAIKNPLKTGNVVTDQLGRQSQRFVGQFGEVVINPQTGKIISVNPTSSSKAAKLLKQSGQ